MSDVVGAQTDLLCPDCGGQCAYDPAHQGLTCASCGNHHDLHCDHSEAARAEIDYSPDQPVQAPIAQGARRHQCQTCGGNVMFTGPALSSHCPYCNGPVVLQVEATGFETMALIPFRVTLDEAWANANNWIANRVAAPGDLVAKFTGARPAGLYAPFFTFDSREAVKYWATHTTGVGDNRRYDIISGKLEIKFDDLLIPGSLHVTPLIRDGILHDFNPWRLVAYDGAFLAGFAAESHHQTVREGLTLKRREKRLLIRNRIRDHINKSGVSDIRYETDTSGIRYRRILLPLWILHYDYKGRAMKVVVSGIDGRTFGERPFSQWKIAGISAAITAITMAIGLAWGSAGLL